MSIAGSLTNDVKSQWAAARRAIVDVRHLVWFRTTSRRRGKTALKLAALFFILTACAAIIPAYVEDAGSGDRAFDLLLLLPSLFAGFLVLAIVSAAASGGGRELLARDAATVHPVSPTTDHLGALLLSPLNIAWLLQAWTLMGVTAYAVGSEFVWVAQPIIIVWLIASTAIAQVIAWTIEGVRRVTNGILMVRTLTLIAIAIGLTLQLNGEHVPLLDQIPTPALVITMVADNWVRWGVTMAGLIIVAVFAIALGALPAHWAARRAPSDELLVEAGHYAPRNLPRTPLSGLIRMDRASVWRAVPMRRGLAVLALGPGIVALLGNLPWSSMTILPGLVASGGALLYGVNAWCLDAKGSLWRESLPVDPSAVFIARAVVLAEFLLAASLVTVALAAVRAGVPEAPELTAMVCTLLVVTVQVVGAAMRWSAQRPFPVDLRSARATPAPPIWMVAYSSRLAISTTLTGVVFSGLAQARDWRLAAIVAIPFLCWSSARLVRAHTRFLNPVERARIMTTVAAH